MANSPEYQLEVKLTIMKLDSNGSPDYRDRFELGDTMKLGEMPLPQLLEIMGNIHAAISNIGKIASNGIVYKGPL